MKTAALIKFRSELAWIKKTGDLAHDKYLHDLKKLIDDELISEKPDVAKVMNYIFLNQMKFELKGTE